MSEVDWNGDAFVARLRSAVDAGLTGAAMVGANAAASSIKGSAGMSIPGLPPASRTGNLRNSIVYVSPERLGISGKAAFGTNAPYGRIIELGGIVRAKRAKALPVPINEAARRMLRGLAGASLRTKQLVQVKRAGKPPLLIEKTPTGRDKKNGAVFVLVSSVTISARPYLTTAARNSMAEMRQAFVDFARSRLALSR